MSGASYGERNVRQSRRLNLDVKWGFVSQPSSCQQAFKVESIGMFRCRGCSEIDTPCNDRMRLNIITPGLSFP
jgi:hypothetical protein